MKNRHSSAHLYLVCTAIMLTLSLNAFSQKTVIWRGGTPGQETNWYCAKNWSTNTVPDAFSNVVILDVSTTSQAMPEILSGAVEVNRLTIAHNASLSLGQSAQLVVLEDMEGFEISGLRTNGRLMALKDMRR